MHSFKTFLNEQKTHSARKRLAWQGCDLDHSAPIHEKFSFPWSAPKYNGLDTATPEEHSPDTKLSSAELEHQAKHRATLSPRQNLAHRMYKSVTDSFNRPLRDNYDDGSKTIRMGGSSIGLDKPVDPEFRENVDHMDTVTSLPTKEPMIMYRGIGRSVNPSKLKPGDKFTDHGYTGLSRYKHIAALYGTKNGEHTTIAKVHIPAGSHGHLLDHPDISSSHQYEGEYTLRRGNQMEVTKHTTHVDPESGAKYHMVHMNLIGQHPAPIED